MIKEFPRPNEGYTLYIDTATKEKWRVYDDGVVRPGTIKRAINFTKAAVGHAAAGRPRANAEQIKERFDICQNCPSNLYEVLGIEKIPAALAKKLPEVGTCKHKSCGCFIHPDPELTPSKLAWGDQKCPLGHWSKVEADKDG